MKRLLVLTFVALLVGCSDEKKIVNLKVKYLPTDRVPSRLVDTQAQTQVAEAATAVGQSLQELSAVQMTVHPPQKLQKPFNPHVIGMDKMASVSWTGPVQPLLQQIADASHYKLRVLGKHPSIPVLVSLDVHNEALADILRDVTYQVVMKSDIAIYPESRTLELRYHGN
ncbi:MAG: LuxR family transcriptional regulator [Gammaproteobacteria bacterium RIFCSPHIGHO2_12_FULL_45_9]|nr:MAG: LuxR family transcriptional regulator [Gammaproteobacteria bacterium RIFCSPHIGHO2_12_FULL_45_9]